MTKTLTPIIDKFAKIMDSIDESNPDDIAKLQDILRRRPENPFDYAKVSGGMAGEIERISALHGVVPDAIFNTMLVILSTACGQHTEIFSPETGQWVKPSLYVINIGGSATGKTPTFKMMSVPTIVKRTKELTLGTEATIRQIEESDLGIQEKTAKAMSEHHRMKLPMVTSYNRPSLSENLRNGAVMLSFDELSTFKVINTNKQDPMMDFLTTMASSYSYIISRKGAYNQSILDGSLNLYGHGPEGPEVRSLFDEEYLKSGTTYRFIFTYTEASIIEPYQSGGFSARMNKKRPAATPPNNFISIFDKIFDRHYLTIDNTRFQYRYTKEAVEAKDMVSRGILGGYRDLCNRSGDIVRSKMIGKMPEYVDKFALLFHMIKFYDTCDVFNAGHEFLIDADCVDMAFDYVRTVFNYWLDLWVVTEAETTKAIESEKAKMSQARSTKQSDRMQMFVSFIGGHGEYTLEKVTEALERLPKATASERMKKGRIAKDLFALWNEEKKLYIL